MEIYLTDDLKKYYMGDFNDNVLTLSDPFWKLDEGLENILVDINKNKNIQSLYSKKAFLSKPQFRQNSYIRFCYTEAVKKQLIIFEEMAKAEFGDLDEDEELNYEYILPEDNCVYSIDRKYKMGCKINYDFFRINMIRIELVSWDREKHDKFWVLIHNKLSKIKENYDVGE